MIRLAACDDDVSLLNQIEELCQDFKGTDISCDLYESPERLLEYEKTSHGLAYEVILMDIEMQGSNGIDAVREIRKIDTHTIIVFVTSHDEFMEEALEVRAFRYVVKPIKQEQFNKVMRDVIYQISQMNVKFNFKFGRSCYLINCKEIIYFHKEQKKFSIFTDDGGVYVCPMTKVEIERRLDEDIFCDVSPIDIVNLAYVDTYNDESVILKNGIVLDVAKSKRKNLKEKLMYFALYRRCRG